MESENSDRGARSGHVGAHDDVDQPGCILVGLSATGLHDHGAPSRPCCEGCGGRPSALQAEIRTLRTSPRWKSRDDAADALRKFDWKQHPEAVFALCDALLLDPKDDVREEAAESLKKMAPCVPMVHEALRRASVNDPNDDVREEARDALKSLGKRCVVDCQVCGPPSANSVGRGSREIPPGWLPILVPNRGAFPANGPAPETGPLLEAIPSNTLPPALPNPDVPPPPPTPYQPAAGAERRAGQVGSKSQI